jgi:non-specific serine/threonine protein kinase
MWRARDAAQRERRVLKIATDSVGLVSLQHELAILTHLQNTLGERSDIARLHSSNLDQTPCFLELQDGGNDLAAWAAQDAHLPEMSIDDRVELFCQVAEVLRALHSVGVVYVDLRPRNILITGQARRWRVRLANFAASRVSAPLDRLPGQSRSGVPLTEPFDTSVTPGALLYRAPELARGEPPNRQTDIYALGVLLYQLVAGDFSRTPSPGWERDVEDAALREHIAAATDLDPAQRLSSVEALVRRLHGLSRRRRGLRAAGVLSSGGGARLWQVLRISRRVSLGVGLCVAALCALLAGWQVMRYRATQSVATDGIAALMELYKAADQNGGGVLQHAEVLDAVLRGRFVRDPVIRAALLLEVASAHFRRSELTQAEAAQREAVLLLERAQGPDHPATLMAEYDLVRILDARQQYDEAGSLLALADQHAGGRPDGSPELRLLALWTRGGHELMLQGAAGALVQYEQLERLQQRWKPGDLIWRLRAQGGLAACMLLMGQNHEALLLIEDLIRPEYSIDKVGLRDWAQLRMQHARALANLGRRNEAGREAEEVLAEVRASGGPGSYVAGLVWDDLAGVRRAAGMFREALDAERQGYQIMKEHIGARGQATLLMRGRIGELEYLADEPARAVETLQEVHGEMVSALGDGSPLAQLAAFHLAAALSDSGRAGEAAPVAAQLNPRALAAAEAAVHWDRRLMALDADIRIRTGRVPRAARLPQETAAQQSPQGGPDWVLAHLQHERISSGAGHGSG